MLPPLTAHIYCNVMGIYLPGSAIRRHPNKAAGEFCCLIQFSGVAGWSWWPRSGVCTSSEMQPSMLLRVKADKMHVRHVSHLGIILGRHRSIHLGFEGTMSARMDKGTDPWWSFPHDSKRKMHCSERRFLFYQRRAFNEGHSQYFNN